MQLTGGWILCGPALEFLIEFYSDFQPWVSPRFWLSPMEVSDRLCG